MSMQLAWGKKISLEFQRKIIAVSERLNVNPSHLMACIAFETAGTFDPSIENAAGSGAIGLIQFMPQTAQSLGTTTEELSRMTAVEQLDFVESYFRQFQRPLKTLEDLYMAILWPGAIGKPSNFVLFDKNDSRNPDLYEQNDGLDIDEDGLITKKEATTRVTQYLEEGMQAGLVVTIENEVILETKMNNSRFFLIYSQHFDRDFGLDEGRLTLNHLDEGTKEIWTATSSTEGKQYPESFHDLNGLIPPHYRVKELSGKSWMARTKPVFVPANENPGIAGNFYEIIPNLVTTDRGGVRGDFGIHRDANVPGSLGCIVMSGDRFRLFEAKMRDLEEKDILEIPLFVQYS